MNQEELYEEEARVTLPVDPIDAETVIVTRDGEPVGYFLPVPDPQGSVREAIEELKRLRKLSPLNGLKIKDLIEEGRRY